MLSRGGVGAAGHALSPLQRLLLCGSSAMLTLLDPFRGDLLATLGETAVPPMQLRRLRRRMAKSTEGAELLARKPNLTSENLNFDELKKLPTTTFGRKYNDFMSFYNYTPEGRSPVRFISDPELAFVMQRYRQTHDFVHVLVGVPTSVLGELAVKCLELLQTGLPHCGIAAMFGPLRMSFPEKRVFVTKLLPWAVQCNRNASFLLGVDFEKRFEHDIDDVRRELGVSPAPWKEVEQQLGHAQ